MTTTTVLLSTSTKMAGQSR